MTYVSLLRYVSRFLSLYRKAPTKITRDSVRQFKESQKAQAAAAQATSEEETDRSRGLPQEDSDRSRGIPQEGDEFLRAPSPDKPRPARTYGQRASDAMSKVLANTEALRKKN